MSYARLLDHRCDIYHVKTTSSSVGYGVPDETTYLYETTPDIQNVSCHFVSGVGAKGSYNRVRQDKSDDPNRKLEDSWLVHFLIGTDVRINDRVNWNGQILNLGLPENVRNHHIEVMAWRDNSL